MAFEIINLLTYLLTYLRLQSAAVLLNTNRNIWL